MRSLLLVAGRQRDATLTCVLAYAGLRPGEALALRWSDVRQRTLLIEPALADGELKATKTGQLRAVALLSALKEDLDLWRLASPHAGDDDLLFARRDGRPWRDHDWRNRRRGVFEPIAQAAGLTGARPYDLRHSFVSLLIHEGRSVVEVAAQAGHSPTMTLSTYAHVIAELEGAERISADEQIRRARGEAIPVSYLEEKTREETPEALCRTRTGDPFLTIGVGAVTTGVPRSTRFAIFLLASKMRAEFMVVDDTRRTRRNPSIGPGLAPESPRPSCDGNDVARGRRSGVFTAAAASQRFAPFAAGQHGRGAVSALRDHDAMALRQFAEHLTTMVASLAQSASLTVVVGAGVSAEARLPPWRALLEDLLDRAGRERLGLHDDALREAWVAQILDGESPLGAAAVAEALADPDLPSWIPDALYRDNPERYQPGPIARRLPGLRAVFGTGLPASETNYDDLVERTFEDTDDGVTAVPFVGPGGRAVPQTDGGHQRVAHLHGFLARDGTRDGHIVLTEEDYQRVAQADWQRAEVGHALMNSPCLFIGSSLTDPNLLRYLHAHSGPGSPRHFVIFTRQDAYPEKTPPEVIAAREEALAARWRAANLEIIFVDHYAEIAQALAEIRRAKDDVPDYRPLPDRLAAWHARVRDGLLMPGTQGAFAAAQDLLHDALRIALDVAVETAGDLGYPFGDEVLAATLFLVDETGDTLTNWATTDRVHRDPATIDPIPIDEHSRWVAVRAFCRGAALGEPRSIYASRWKYIRGLPLMTADDLPVGVLTVASMRPKDQTMLDDMPDTIEAAFDDALRAVALDILNIPFEHD
jgi:hypothetical protein